MTVGELIDALSKFDRNYEVFLGHEGGYDYDLDVYERDSSEIWDIEVDGDEIILDGEYRHKKYGRMCWPAKERPVKKQNNKE